MSVLEVLVGPVAGVLERLIPDATKRAEAAHEIATLAEKQHQAIMMGQIEVNKEDAKSGNWFQYGWRPAVGWVCVLGMINNFLLLPYMMVLSDKIVPMDWAEMSPILLGLLGLGTLRTLEKVKGKA